MKKIVLLFTTAVIALSACDEGPKQGYIEDTWHEPPQPYTVMNCISYGKYGCNLSVPVTEYTGDTYHIFLRDPGKKPGWREVAWSDIRALPSRFLLSEVQVRKGTDQRYSRMSKRSTSRAGLRANGRKPRKGEVERREERRSQRRAVAERRDDGAGARNISDPNRHNRR